MARCKGWKSPCGTPCTGNYPASMARPGTTTLRCRSLPWPRPLLATPKLPLRNAKSRSFRRVSWRNYRLASGCPSSGLARAASMKCGSGVPSCTKRFPTRSCRGRRCTTLSTACGLCATGSPIMSPFFSGILQTITKASSRCWRGYAQIRPPGSGITAPSRQFSRLGHDVPPSAKRIRRYGSSWKAE